MPRYERLYGRGAYAPREERARLSKLVRRAGMQSGFSLRSTASERDAEWSDDASAPSSAPPPRSLQTSLF